MGDGFCNTHKDSEQGNYLIENGQPIVKDSKLAILSLNACGIISKLNCPDLIGLIQKYDIIGIQETKTDDLDTISIPGYKVFVKNRSCISKNGIALIVKEAILPYIKVHDTKSSDLILLFIYTFKIIPSCGQFEDLTC